MEIFLDTAKIEEIREAAKLGVISGVTTNPSLMMTAGRSDYKEVTQEVCYLVQGPVSAEVTELEADKMVEQAKEIAQWSPHVVIKIPVTAEGLQAISTLVELEVEPESICQGCAWLGQCDTDPDIAHDPSGRASGRSLVYTWGIRTNATLVFSANQALLAALAGASFVSIFVGRLDDAGNDGMQVVADIVEIFETYGLDTEIIAASIRHPMHIVEAALLGADIATVPYDVLMQAIKHPLTDVGIERFLADWRKVSQK
ncbi:MAG: transaldolase family protein [Anaerolineae bacterium]